jgi:hypothetical protein
LRAVESEPAGVQVPEAPLARQLGACVQAGALIFALNVPAAHGAQTASDVAEPATYWPGMQTVGDHGVQAVAFVAVLNVPVTHGAQMSCVAVPANLHRVERDLLGR